MLKTSRKFNPQVDDKNWSILFDTHFQNLQSLNAISTLWINGLSKMGMNMRSRPKAEELNKSIAKFTGYHFVQTDDNIILPQDEWYGMISRFEMPLTSFVRSPEELDYCDEPDIFHDIMGHVPFLAEQEYSDMYQELAKTYLLAFQQKREDLLKELDFIGGMIIELGLIREDSGIKAFGATFYSSGEVLEAFKPANQLKFTPKSLKSGESYDRHSFQGKYYIFDGMEELNWMISQVKERL